MLPCRLGADATPGLNLGALDDASAWLSYYRLDAKIEPEVESVNA